MKKLNFLITALLLMVINSYGQNNKTYNIDAFSKLSLAFPANVIVTQGNSTSFTVEGDNSIIEKMVVENDGNELIIEKKRRRDRIRGYVTIKITTPELKSVEIAGSGSVKSDNAINTESFKTSIAGSGNVNIEFKSDMTDIDVEIAGSGSVKYRGDITIGDLEVDIAGSGNFNGKSITTKFADISIAGSGDCYVNATEKVAGSVAGSGNIYYSGKPVIKFESAGSGKIRQY